ncbi:hypothetical protein C8J57DRAFT_1049507 [Mycena rebaudengoi]|nr:hypothetical protein C8J57DRAFT_1049507 [Mycena rebaudengoi]
MGAEQKSIDGRFCLNIFTRLYPCVPFDSTPGVFDTALWFLYVQLLIAPTEIFVETQLRGTGFTAAGGNPGETESPLAAEIRLGSDASVNSCTTCTWQSFANNQVAMQSAFKAAMRRMSLIGQDEYKMVDCSDVIPVPPPLSAKNSPHLPAGLTMDHTEQAVCRWPSPFPTLTGDPGKEL